MPKIFDIYEWAIFRKYSIKEILIARQEIAKQHSQIIPGTDDIKEKVTVKEAIDIINTLQSNKFSEEL